MDEVSFEELTRLLDEPGTNAHFMGVGGAGMAPLAAIVAGFGWRTSGCDLSQNETTVQLADAGVSVQLGHAPEHLAGQRMLVVSSAVPNTQPEVAAALAVGIPVVKRARLTGALTRRTRAVCVAGTHGKTTTTSMTAAALMAAGADPSALVGAAVPGIGVGGRVGRGDLLVVESDEFDRSFLNFRPFVAIVTNVEADHLDYYGSRAEIDEAFRQFLALVPPDGHRVLCGDDPGSRALAVGGDLLYGFGRDCTFRGEGLVATDDGGMRFSVDGVPVDLQVPGRHNALDALAALATCRCLGFDLARSAEGLAAFQGAARRFEKKGEVRGVAVYDDYGHNPTKVRAGLAAARQRARGRVWCLFQPHTFHRTASLWDGFVEAFGDADELLILDVYSPAGRERPMPEITSERLAAAIPRSAARYVPTREEAVETIGREARPGDLLVVMGAGDVTNLCRPILERLAR